MLRPDASGLPDFRLSRNALRLFKYPITNYCIVNYFVQPQCIAALRVLPIFALPMKKMNILLLGSGGREHAFAWKLSQSDLLNKLFIAPGNAGTSNHGSNVNLSVNDFEGIKKCCIENAIDLLVVGPEEPLVRGIHDLFLADPSLKHIPVIGPQKAGAVLEGSKAFSKEFMKRHAIPTAAYGTFTADNLDDAERFLETLSAPYVLKADGLAAGKGVLIVDTLEQARSELREMLSGNMLGAAGTTVVIEEFLAGVELSVFILTDGKDYVLLPEAKDYKRIGVGDTGLNTGGMGAVSPVPFANGAFMSKVRDRIIEPTVHGLRKEGIPYTGFIFFGLINVKGEPYVIEYNCRMGDPETEAVLPRIQSDLLELLVAAGHGKLSGMKLETDHRSALTIMTVAGGYPGAYEKGKQITGFESIEDALVFHAGTKEEEDKVLSAGGRVMALTALGNSAKEAREKAFREVKKIQFEHAYYRNDIGKDMLEEFIS